MKSIARPGVTGTPASCSRRESAPASGGRSSSIVSTPKVGFSVTGADELFEAGGADRLLVLRCISAPTRACARPRLRRDARCRAPAGRRASRSPPRSPAASAHRSRASAETAFATCTASDSDTPLTRRRCSSRQVPVRAFAMTSVDDWHAAGRNWASRSGSRSPGTMARRMAWPVTPGMSVSTALNGRFMRFSACCLWRIGGARCAINGGPMPEERA